MISRRLAFPDKLNFHPAASLTLLVSELLPADGLHPFNPITVKVVDWACVFSEEVGRFQFVPSCHQTYGCSG